MSNFRLFTNLKSGSPVYCLEDGAFPTKSPVFKLLSKGYCGFCGPVTGSSLFKILCTHFHNFRVELASSDADTGVEFCSWASFIPSLLIGLMDFPIKVPQLNG